MKEDGRAENVCDAMAKEDGEGERKRKRGDMLLSISSTFHPIPSRGDITDNYQL